jgi:hypothetical protein
LFDELSKKISGEWAQKERLAVKTRAVAFPLPTNKTDIQTLRNQSVSCQRKTFCPFSLAVEMDSDRKSAVSSFYGGRKSSIDALNVNPNSPSTPQFGPTGDGASSFFNPDRGSRGSVDLLNSGQPNSAGYNSLSFLHAGREEPLRGGRDEEEAADGAWDVFADFNNAGPRYSEAFGQFDPG